MASILYLATDEGVVTLKSEDGRYWKVEHHGLKDWQVPEVAVSPAAPNKVFAGTRGDGVWLSEDFGATWKKPSYGKRGPGKVRCLSFDPLDPEYTLCRHRAHRRFYQPRCGEKLGSSRYRVEYSLG